MLDCVSRTKMTRCGHIFRKLKFSHLVLTGGQEASGSSPDTPTKIKTLEIVEVSRVFLMSIFRFALYKYLYNQVHSSPKVWTRCGQVHRSLRLLVHIIEFFYGI